MRTEHPVIFFDGVCNLCNASVQFVIRHDPNAYFRFAPLQGDYAHEVLGDLDDGAADPGSIVLLDNGIIYKRSSAALRIARKLSGGWRLLYGFMVVPTFLRDAVYNLVARNRYKVWGRQESCWVPTEDLKARFLS